MSASARTHFHTDTASMQTFDTSLREENEVSDMLCVSYVSHHSTRPPHTSVGVSRAVKRLADVSAQTTV